MVWSITALGPLGWLEAASLQLIILPSFLAPPSSGPWPGYWSKSAISQDFPTSYRENNRWALCRHFLFSFWFQHGSRPALRISWSAGTVKAAATCCGRENFGKPVKKETRAPAEALTFIHKICFLNQWVLKQSLQPWLKKLLFSSSLLFLFCSKCILA